MKWIAATFLIILLLSVPASAAIILAWDPVTTDIHGFPELGVVTYRIWARKAFSQDAWVKIGETTALSQDVPVGAGKLEYSLTALDEAGNESGRSESATARPGTPPKPRVN